MADRATQRSPDPAAADPGTSARADRAPPAFNAPWQAQVFALTVALNEAGHFSWADWAKYLGQEVAARSGASDHSGRALPAIDDLQANDAYFECWTAALERLLEDRRIAPPLALSALRQAWRVAAEKTPHGQPIRLNRAALRLAGLSGDRD